MGDQMRHLMSHGLAQEIFAVFAVQLRIEAEQVFMQVRDTGLLAPQFEADDWAFEWAFEEIFGLLVTGFDAGIELLEHASSVSRGCKYAAKRVLAENSSCRMVVKPPPSRVGARLPAIAFCLTDVHV
jgi:hypothetical protein